MIVTPESIVEVAQKLKGCSKIALDLETTGLNPLVDKIIGFAFAIDSGESFYVPTGGEHPLSVGDVREHLAPIFSDPNILWVNHNFKFDLNFLAANQIDLTGSVYCTLVGARLQYNDHMRYSLDACATRIGESKIDEVKKYMDQNKLFEYESIPGKKTRVKNYFFDKVPLDLLARYAEQDAIIAYKLHHFQTDTFSQWDKERITKLPELLELSSKVTRVVSKMETHGILIDRAYCKKAIAYESNRIDEATETLSSLAAKPFVDSAKWLSPVMRKLGVEPALTEKGNESFDSESLLKYKDIPEVKALLTYRDANKRRGTYFSSFLYYSRHDSRIHCNLNPGGTGTGRFSASNPNLQNLSDESDDETPFPVRKAFLADEGCYLISKDYSAMEYRMMLDYTDQMDVIEQVLSGEDIHQACANLIGMERRVGKLINFLLLYGGGVGKLAEALHISLPEAHAIREKYFVNLPHVTRFIKHVVGVAKTRGYIHNWMGRRYYFAYEQSYKAPNYLIQGGCSDVVRHALVKADSILSQGNHGKLQLQIHDELVMSIRKDSLDVVPQIKKAMIEAYPHKKLPMDVGVYISETSLHDLQDYQIS